MRTFELSKVEVPENLVFIYASSRQNKLNVNKKEKN